MKKQQQHSFSILSLYPKLFFLLTMGCKNRGIILIDSENEFPYCKGIMGPCILISLLSDDIDRGDTFQANKKTDDDNKIMFH